MEYGKTKLIDMLTNVPKEGWSRQKVKDMVDTLWRNPIFLRWSGFEFAGGTDCNISFNEATRVFTIAPKINVFTYYQYRNKLTYHVMNKAYEVEIPDTQGLHIIYFDADTNTKAQVLLSTMPDDDKIEEIYLFKVAVAWIYWIPEDPILEIPGQAIYFGDSRHGSEWPNQVHWWNHRTTNSERESGLTITDTQADRDGSLNTHAQFDINPGSVFHSDIRQELDGSSPASLPIWFMTNGAPNIVSNSGYCFYVDGLICYNNGSAATAAKDGYFVMYHLFATNCSINPLISAMGLGEYELIGDAMKAMQHEIDSIRHTFPHSNLMLIDTVIFQTSAAYGNDVKTRLVVMPAGGSGLSEISFEWCITPGVAETFNVDIYSTKGYSISKAILESDGTLDGAMLKIDGVAVTGLDDMDVSTVAVFTATANNVAAIGERVTLVTSGDDTGTPTYLRGKIVLA